MVLEDVESDSDVIGVVRVMVDGLCEAWAYIAGLSVTTCISASTYPILSSSILCLPGEFSMQMSLLMYGLF